MSCNTNPKLVFQGQTHGHNGFLLSNEKVYDLLNSNNSKILKPFLIGDTLVGTSDKTPKRHVIDFTGLDIIDASSYKTLFDIIKNQVLPDRKAKAVKQENENAEALRKNAKAKVNKHHINFYNKWWQLSYGRQNLIKKLPEYSRYISCSRVSSRPIFEFISSEINPNDALMVFLLEDDYSFGIIQSIAHIKWYQEKCSSMKGDPRYTPTSIWDTFPFPQAPTLNNVKKVAEASIELRLKRNQIIEKYGYCLRDIYNILTEPGSNPIKDAHKKLDDAVFAAYGFSKRKDILSQLLELNFEVALKIENGESVQSPGLPVCVKKKKEFISEDSVKMKLK